MNPLRWSFRAQFLFGFLICAGLLGYAIYVQLQLGIEPCPLCIFQRIAFAARAWPAPGTWPASW
jgi:disulfide bond formation protein DsbB